MGEAGLEVESPMALTESMGFTLSLLSSIIFGVPSMVVFS